MAVARIAATVLSTDLNMSMENAERIHKMAAMNAVQWLFEWLKDQASLPFKWTVLLLFPLFFLSHVCSVTHKTIFSLSICPFLSASLLHDLLYPILTRICTPHQLSAIIVISETLCRMQISVTGLYGNFRFRLSQKSIPYTPGVWTTKGFFASCLHRTLAFPLIPLYLPNQHVHVDRAIRRIDCEVDFGQNLQSNEMNW